MRLTWVDYVVFFALLRGFYVGYREGIFPELLRIASYMLTVLVAFYFYEQVAQQLTLRTFMNNATATAVAFVALVVTVFLVTKLLRMLLLKLLKVGEGGFFLRTVGLLLGGLRWLI